MARPQNEELNRSGNTPLDPDSIGGRLEARDQPQADDHMGGPVPPENRPGHHPETEQDQPDADAFVARFSGRDGTEAGETRAEIMSRVKDTASTVGQTMAMFWASARRVGKATADAVRHEVGNRNEKDGTDEQ
ncbi:MAG: hypothetical protein RIB98_18455 [Acidimicrobiales bacterium]